MDNGALLHCSVREVLESREPPYAKTSRIIELLVDHIRLTDPYLATVLTVEIKAFERFGTWRPQVPYANRP